MGTSFSFGATVTRADIPVLCRDLAELLRSAGAGVVTCDLAGVTCPDVVTVEALARLHLTARRHGRRLVVTGAGPHLRQLVALLGLGDVLSGPPAEVSGQVGGQPEEWEQPPGVEEVVDRRDPSA